MLAAAVLTVPAGYLFQHATHQAGIEASLAISTVAITFWFARGVRSATLRVPLLGVLAALTLILVRQTMEIEVVLWAALVELRSLGATVAVGAAVIVSMIAALAWTVIARWLSIETVRRATLAFAALFFVQGLVYAFHESAEARVLPWSEVLHAASEPYGPEGEYGRQVSFLLFLVPLVTAAALQVRDRVARLSLFGRRRFALISMAAVACVVLVTAVSGGARAFREAAPAPASPVAMASITASPHLVYRHTGVDVNYNLTKVAALDRADTSAGAGIRCERVSFGAGRGICLQADRGMFTTYKAVVFDRTFTPTSAVSVLNCALPFLLKNATIRSTSAITSGPMPSPGSSRRECVVIGVTPYVRVDERALLACASGPCKGGRLQFLGCDVHARQQRLLCVARQRRQDLLSRAISRCASSSCWRRTSSARRYRPTTGRSCSSAASGPRRTRRFYVMDLATMNARPLASETRFVDDQASGSTTATSSTRSAPSSGTSDVWVAPIDDSAPAKIFMPEASSPMLR
jgi:hypothetical protein